MTATKARKPRPKGPGRLSAEQTALLAPRLLDAAQSVFIEMGYARATMDAIAKAAGASRKTLYARYANKAEVLTAVVNRLLDAVLPPQDGTSASAPTTLDPRVQLLHIAHQISGLSSTPHVAGLNRLIMAEAAQIPELARLFINLHERATTTVGRSLDALKAEGRLKHLPPTHIAAMLFIEMVDSVPRLRAVLGQPMSKKEMETLATTAVDMFLRGVA